MEAVLTVTVNVLVMVEEQDGIFLADCPFLNIVSQGKTEDEAIARFQEEMQFLFETCQKSGELEALLDHRTALRKPAERGQEFVMMKKKRVPAEIPAGLLMQFSNAAAAFN